MHVHDAAFEQLYTEYVHRLIRYARAQGQSGDVAEELVQDTFHEAYAQLAHLTEHENPGGWLMQTLKNKIRNYDRARQRERRLMAATTTLPMSITMVNSSKYQSPHQVKVFRPRKLAKTGTCSPSQT